MVALRKFCIVVGGVGVTGSTHASDSSPVTNAKNSFAYGTSGLYSFQFLWHVFRSA